MVTYNQRAFTMPCYLTIQIIMWTTQIWRSKRFECAKRKSSNRRKKKQCWLRTVVVQHIHHSLLSRGPVAVCVLLVPFGLNGWMQRLAALNVLLNESSICFLIQIQTLHPPESPFKLWSFKQTMKAKMRHFSLAIMYVDDVCVLENVCPPLPVMYTVVFEAL